MNLDKSRTKIDLTKAIGAQIADIRKEAGKDQLRQEGARDALKLAAKRIGDLGLQVDKDLEDGVLSPEDLRDPKKVEIFIKRWNKRAVGVLDNLATTAEIARTIASGREKGISASEQIVRKMCEAEITKLQAVERMLQSGETTVEELQSGHPGLPLKYRREDEKSESKPESKSEPAPEPKSEPELEFKPESKPAPSSTSEKKPDKRKAAQRAMAAVSRKRAKDKAGTKRG